VRSLFDVTWHNGISVSAPGLNIILDPLRVTKASDYVFISHAHMDHTNAFTDSSKIKYATPETIALYEAITQKKVKNTLPCVYDKTIEHHQTTLKVIKSGHVFGSAAVQMATKDVTFLYTGDFNYVDSLMQKAISPIECDVLVIESTYGRPDYIFPERNLVYDEIVDWAARTIMEGGLPIILSYPVGKAQELTKLFNMYTSIPVVTHPSITRTNEAVNRFGQSLVYYDMAKEGEELIRSKSCVCIYPTCYRPNALRCVYPDSKIATVTGWALSFGKRSADVSFILSSHADYAQLIKFVEECKPKNVYTVHGFSEIFAHKLCKKGINARSLC